MKKNFQFVMVNGFFWIITLSVLLYIHNHNFILINKDNVLLLFLTFFFIHLFKCVRMYLLLIESNIRLKDFLQLYVLSTFCSIILPYKTGELYKAYLYGYKTKKYSTGLLAVIIDKFFDALLLLAIFIPFELSTGSGLSILTFILLVFVILFIIAYFSFEQTFYYLNRHFMVHSQSKRSIYMLKFLEKCNDIYKYVKNMIKARGVLLLLCTIVAWALELLFLSILNSGKIFSYINSVFFGMQNDILKSYIVIGLVYFIVIECIVIFKKVWCKK